MPKRDPDLLIEDILAAVRRVERYTSGMDQTLFRQDEKTVDAVVRNLEIIGEAARQLPADFLGRYPDVPCGRSPVCATALCTSTLDWILSSSGRSSAKICRSSKPALRI